MAETGSSQCILGKWKSVEDTNGWNFILEFGQDGSYSMTMIMENSGTYSVVGRQIRSQSEKEGTETEEFRIEDDTLFERTQKSEHRLERMGSAKDLASPLIGKWHCIEKFSNGEAYEYVVEYKGKDEFEASVIMEPQRGSYKISGNSLTTTLGGESSIMTFRINRDTLIMDEGAVRTKFRRIRQPNSTQSSARQLRNEVKH